MVNFADEVVVEANAGRCSHVVAHLAFEVPPSPYVPGEPVNYVLSIRG